MICTPNFVCKLELSFSNIFSKKSRWKLHVFFLRKNQFLPIFHTQNDHFSIFEGVLTLWHHSASDVIHKWLVLILFLVSLERGCPYLYTGSKFRLIWPSVLIIRRGVATTPFRKICLGKPSGEQGLSNFCQKKKTKKNLSKYCHMGSWIAIMQHNICMYSSGELIYWCAPLKLKAYSLMSNRGRSQNFKNVIFFCIFVVHSYKKHTSPKELGWNNFSMKWEQFLQKSLGHETLFNTVLGAMKYT